MNMPKPGEVWEIAMWSPESTNTFSVLVLKKMDKREMTANHWESEDNVFQCLEGDTIRSLPAWMFANAKLISGQNITL